MSKPRTNDRPTWGYLTGTMRTGSGLVESLLTSNLDVHVVSELVHYYRFLSHRLSSGVNDAETYRALLESSARTRYRFGIITNPDKIFQALQACGEDKGARYKAILQGWVPCHIQAGAIVERAALSWQNIPDYLGMLPDGKVIHLLRDPRAVLASWKRITGITGYAYLNCVLNWIHSAKKHLEYKKLFSQEQYRTFLHEEILESPKGFLREVSGFLGVDYDKDAEVITSKGNRPRIFNRSAHGHSLKTVNPDTAMAWKDILAPWEVLFVQKHAGPVMEELGYASAAVSSSKEDPERQLKNIETDDFMSRCLAMNRKEHMGNHLYPSDPTLPENWGAPDDPSGWFTDSDAAQGYFSEMDKIDMRVKKKFGTQGPKNDSTERNR